MSAVAERAGALVRDSMNTDQSVARHASERARLVERATQRESRAVRPRPALGWAAAAAGALVAVVLVIAVLVPRSKPAALSFQVGEAGEPGRVGRYYAAVDNAKLPLIFSDGSVVTIAPDSAMRVAQAMSREVVLHLENGGAGVNVNRRDGAHWKVHAGPYTVRVTGTEFHIEWNNLARRVTVEMQSGEVVVTGPGIESGVRVSGTERFVSRAVANVEPAGDDPTKTVPSGAPEQGDRSEATEGDEPVGPGSEKPGPSTGAGPDDSPSDGAPEQEPADPEIAQPEAADERDLSARSLPAEGTEAEDWASLARNGKYVAIISDAEQRGVEEVLGSAKASELEVLADAARLTGRPDLAQRTLHALRRRFAGSPAAADAAFVLGKIAERGGAREKALSWYRRHVSEGGSLVPEALGRRMLLLRRLGREAASRQAAEEYLQQFPEGAYSSQARDMIEGAREP